MIYSVKRGDTLSRIANRFGVSVKSIANANGIKNVNRISVNQQLVIPSGNVSVKLPITDINRESQVMDINKTINPNAALNLEKFSQGINAKVLDRYTRKPMEIDINGGFTPSEPFYKKWWFYAAIAGIVLVMTGSKETPVKRRVKK